MKKVFYILAISSISITIGCKNTTNVKQNTPNKSEEVTQQAKSNLGTIHLTKAKFIEKVWDYESSPDKWAYKGDKPCIIDFYADWCGPCKIAAPILEELAVEYKNEIYVYKIDTDQEKELARAFGISSIPAFLYCPANGKPQMTAGIGQTPEQTKEMFVNAINELLLAKK